MRPDSRPRCVHCGQNSASEGTMYYHSCFTICPWLLYNSVTMSDAGTEQILQTLDDLCNLEAAMAAYYLACSEKWEPRSSLWMELALEEERHEKVIRDLIKVVNAHPDQFEPGLTVDPATIASYVDNISEMTSDIIKGQVELDAALKFALGMEESILEGRFFEILISRNQKYLVFMETMSRELTQHRQRIIEEMGRDETSDS